MKLVALTLVVAIATIVSVSAAFAYHVPGVGAQNPYTGVNSLGGMYGVYAEEIYVPPHFSQRYTYAYGPRLGGSYCGTSHCIHGLRAGNVYPLPVANIPRYTSPVYNSGAFYRSVRPTHAVHSRYGSHATGYVTQSYGTQHRY